jgi:polycystin 2
MAAKDVIIYIIMLIPIYIGFVLISMIIWGSRHIDFSSFSRAMLTNMLLGVGYGNISELVLIDPIYGIIYLVVYYFVMLYFLLSVFMGLYMDSYRIVMLEN